MRVYAKGQDKAGEFFRISFAGLFEYVSNRIPEIADELYKIDDAMRAGFGWELGPFEVWDAIGVKEGVQMMEQQGKKPAKWVEDMLATGINSFYNVEKGVKAFYDISSQAYKNIPGREAYISLDNLRATHTVWKNSGTTLIDLGDGVLNLEFHTKMNTIGAEVLEGINKAIDMAEKSYKALVIGNDGANFPQALMWE